jgi:hypothetical protein
MRLKPLSLPILIALALFLSGATNEPIEPGPVSSSIPKSERSQIAQQPKAGKTAENSPVPKIPPLDQTQTPDEDNGQDNSDSGTVREANYTGLLVIVGVLAIVISGLNYCATRSAANAARDSAHAAEFALRSDRPFFSVESPQLLYFEPASKSIYYGPIDVTFFFRNCGKGPAIVSKIFARLAIVQPPAPLTTLSDDAYPAFGQYYRCRRIDVQEHVIAQDESSMRYKIQLENNRSDVENGKIADSIFDELCKFELWIVLHVVIRYGDIRQGQWETEWIGRYNPPSADVPDGRFYLSYEDRPQRKGDQQN